MTEQRDDMKRLAESIMAELDSPPTRVEVIKFLQDHHNIARREAHTTGQKTHKVLIEMARNHYNRKTEQ